MGTLEGTESIAGKVTSGPRAGAQGTQLSALREEYWAGGDPVCMFTDPPVRVQCVGPVKHLERRQVARGGVLKGAL